MYRNVEGTLVVWQNTSTDPLHTNDRQPHSRITCCQGLLHMEYIVYSDITVQTDVQQAFYSTIQYIVQYIAIL